MAGEIRVALREKRIELRVVVPRAPARTILGGKRERTRAWERIAPGGQSLGIDNRLGGGKKLGLVSVTGENPKGPFALDLASHFLHPLDRARLLASQDRPRLVAGIAAVAPVDYWIIGTQVGGESLWLTTDDVIAAELWSLALAEGFLDSTREMPGPWEDATVQRATELDLGVRIPSDMRLSFDESPALPEAIGRSLASCCRRLGMRVPTMLR